MPAKRKPDASPKDSSIATIGFEAKLWLAAEGKAEGRMKKEDGVQLLHSSFLLPAFPVLANGSMSSNQSGEGDSRRALFEADLVDTALRGSAFPQKEATPQVLSKAKNNMVARPGQLFYRTQIPVCLWFIEKKRNTTAATFSLN